MENYVQLSLETHLFFARIMKEHGLFLEAGFPCAEQSWIRRSDWYRQQFENLLREVVQISDGRIGKDFVESGEMITEYTMPAERSTQQLSGVSIDSRITMQQGTLNCNRDGNDGRNMKMAVERINRRAMELVDGFIEFKEKLLQETSNGKLFNANYPLLIKHITREAKLYRELLKELLENQELSPRSMRETEDFWNRIMMEHALFIRGLLDPSEEELIEMAHRFSKEYKELLETARKQDNRAVKMMGESLEQTLRYRDFKAAGTKGILECNVSSIILPLLADHVLREANHYIRLLGDIHDESCREEEGNSYRMQNGNTCNCAR